jgi:NAD+ kinase
MSDGSDRRLPADARVAVVGPAAGPVLDALDGTRAVAVDATPGDIPAVDAVVSVGETATAAVGRVRPSVPVLPVDAGPGFRSVPSDAVGAGVADLLAGRWTPLEHPVAALRADGVHERVVMDAMLVTAEPARISEYAVHSRGGPVDSIRADGVVVALPAGSHGYARAADGPVVAPETGVAAVVPVAPFATDADHWVLPLDGLALTVERDETPVELLADDRTVGPVDPDARVRVEPDGSFRTAVVEASGPAW